MKCCKNMIFFTIFTLLFCNNVNGMSLAESPEMREDSMRFSSLAMPERISVEEQEQSMARQQDDLHKKSLEHSRRNSASSVSSAAAVSDFGEPVSRAFTLFQEPVHLPLTPQSSLQDVSTQEDVPVRQIDASQLAAETAYSVAVSTFGKDSAEEIVEPEISLPSSDTVFASVINAVREASMKGDSSPVQVAKSFLNMATAAFKKGEVGTARILLDKAIERYSKMYSPLKEPLLSTLKSLAKREAEKQFPKDVDKQKQYREQLLSEVNQGALSKGRSEVISELNALSLSALKLQSEIDAKQFSRAKDGSLINKSVKYQQALKQATDPQIRKQAIKNAEKFLKSLEQSFLYEPRMVTAMKVDAKRQRETLEDAIAGYEEQLQVVSISSVDRATAQKQQNGIKQKLANDPRFQIVATYDAIEELKISLEEARNFGEIKQPKADLQSILEQQDTSKEDLILEEYFQETPV